MHFNLPIVDPKIISVYFFQMIYAIYNSNNSIWRMRLRNSTNFWTVHSFLMTSCYPCAKIYQWHGGCCCVYDWRDLCTFSLTIFKRLSLFKQRVDFVSLNRLLWSNHAIVSVFIMSRSSVIRIKCVFIWDRALLTQTCWSVIYLIDCK